MIHRPAIARAIRIATGIRALGAAALALGAVAVTGLAPCAAATAQPPPLVLERTIPLAHVAGRIDHMAFDLSRKRLIVAELGNGTVDVIDIAAGTVVHRIAGLKSPQGVAYSGRADRIAVASADDGSVRLYRADDFAPAGVIRLGDDADDARVDPRSGDIVIGYGEGGLAVIDPADAKVLSRVPLAAHPEGFQLAPDGGQIFVNVPDARQIAVVDRVAARQIATWSPADFRANFPMAITDAGDTIATVFRRPARLALIDTATGRSIAEAPTCGDADDVYFDSRRHRVYVSCGEGAVDVFSQVSAGLSHLARVPTASGARTSLFVPALDRLFVAARAGLFDSAAAILVFRPQPGD